MFRRPLHPQIVTLAVALFTLAALNLPFWRMLIDLVPPRNAYEWAFLAAVPVLLLAAFNAVLSLLAWPYVLKPAIVLLLAIASGAAYFVAEYGVHIDTNMMRNAFETNTAEVRDLITPALLGWLAGGALLPALILWKLPIAYRRLLPTLGAAALSLGVAVATFAPFAMDFLSVTHEHKELVHVLAPVNVIRAGSRALKPRHHGGVRIAAGEDARLDGRPAGSTRRSVTVLVVGETARAANWGLNGYARETTPRLATVPGLINFPNVTSCGTDTAQSVPCMFSGLGRAGLGEAIAGDREGLLDILKRAGLDVLWRENQTGCKGVCEGVALDKLTDQPIAPYFEGGETRDEILLDGLADRIAATRADAVIVLHMMGSHGPAYWKRYPQAFEHFKPTCKESQFSRCEIAEIVNAYDNTLRYTDHVLASLIDILAAADRNGIATAMLYVSDHGESLGEEGIFLHGMPIAIAPREQTHVPMVLWLSPVYQRAFSVDAGCVEKRRAAALSHDNFFHSVLGLLDVETRAYDRSLDLFAPCRATAPS